MARNRYDRSYHELRRDKTIQGLQLELKGKREVIERQAAEIERLKGLEEQLRRRVHELEAAAQGELL